MQNISPKELDRLERKLAELDPFMLRDTIKAKLQKAREHKHAA